MLQISDMHADISEAAMRRVIELLDGEALQYDGVPSHTYKDLATLHDTQTKSRKNELETEDMTYGRGRK